MPSPKKAKPIKPAETAAETKPDEPKEENAETAQPQVQEQPTEVPKPEKAELRLVAERNGWKMLEDGDHKNLIQNPAGQIISPALEKLAAERMFDRFASK